MRKRIFILSILFVSFSFLLFSQKEANNWLFGDKAGLNFDNGYVNVLTCSSIAAAAGCSSISDKEGNLLFYTNGMKVWNRMHQLMPNGDSLKGYYGSNQNSLIIQKPADENTYYLFTIDTSGFFYSVVDVSLENGLGDIIQKNKRLSTSVPITDKITAVQHCNSIDTWVIVHKSGPPEFNSILVTGSGIEFSNPVTNSVGSSIMAEIGYMKVSPTGDKIILPINTSTILFELFDFDNNTGEVSNPIQVFKSDEIYAYGTEFSADGKVLYVSIGGLYYQLLQFNPFSETEEIMNQSSTVVGQGNIYALQLATDGKIYSACVNEPYVGIIHSPSLLGLDCLFEKKAIDLGDGICEKGLPNFNQSYFYKPTITYDKACIGENTSYTFEYDSNIDSISWNFGSNQMIISTSFPFNVENMFSTPGNYIVELITYHCGTSDTIQSDIRINEHPFVELGNDTIIFEGDAILLDAGFNMDEYFWNTGYNDRLLEVFETGEYFVEVIKNTCKSSDSISIEVTPILLAYPTAFSPNNDNINDLFEARIFGELQDFYIAIYNRYGDRVYYSNDCNNGWDGRDKGINCMVGEYYWEAAYSIPSYNPPLAKKLQGHVYLLR